jgi:hypothetical protein
MSDERDEDVDVVDEVEAVAVPIPRGLSIATHPRARASIRRVRARAGLAAFGLVLLLCLNAGVPAADAVMRSLVAGVVSFLCAWAIGLTLWKQLLIAEVRAAYERREQRRRALAAQAAERQAARTAAAKA